jgi:hypothetical protein
VTLPCAGKYSLSKTAFNSFLRYCIPIVGSFFEDFAGDGVLLR